MTPISAQNRKRLEKARKEARQRVIERGIVQFRADEELMDQLLQIADYKKVPVGTLVRQWIAPIVSQEFINVPVKEITLPDGRVLTRDSYYRDLEDARYAYQDGKLPLSAREVRTLESWLLDQQELERRAG